MTLYTIGHSNHPLEHFLSLLRRHDITMLADVRSHPVSRWAPHFGKGPLARALQEAGIGYVFLGRELGGRPEGGAFYDEDGRVDYERRALAPEFQAGIERLSELADRERVAVLCAEEDPDRCHRRLLVTPVLEERGIEVCHIRGDGRIERSESQASLF